MVNHVLISDFLPLKSAAVAVCVAIISDSVTLSSCKKHPVLSADQ